MDVYRLKTLSQEERDSVLQGESLSVEEQAYMQPLTPEELAIKKDELAVAAINKAYMEEELAEIKKQYKEKIDPMRLQIVDCISAIKNKAIEVKGKVYKLDDHDNKMIHSVDPLGNVLSSRRMLPEEMQTRIMVPLKESNA